MEIKFVNIIFTMILRCAKKNKKQKRKRFVVPSVNLIDSNSFPTHQSVLCVDCLQCWQEICHYYWTGRKGIWSQSFWLFDMILLVLSSSIQANINCWLAQILCTIYTKWSTAVPGTILAKKQMQKYYFENKWEWANWEFGHHPLLPPTPTFFSSLY